MRRWPVIPVLLVVPVLLHGCSEPYRAVPPNKPWVDSLPLPDSGSDHLLYATFDRSAPELRFAYSRNGYTWARVGNGRAFFTARAALRDPTVRRGPDGRYHCVYTTAHPQMIGYIWSDDLVTWSAPRWLPVMTHEPRTRVCWAPDLTYDRSRREWLITWSSDVEGEFRGDGDTEKFIHRLYATTTRDFTSLGTTWLFFDPGHNVIDPDLVEFEGRYALFYKDARLRPNRKVLMVTEASDPRGPFEPGRETLPLAPIEGSSAIVQDSALVVYFDAYNDDAMGAMQSSDLVNWTDISPDTWFPPRHRHGSVLRVSPEAFERVLGAGASPES